MLNNNLQKPKQNDLEITFQKDYNHETMGTRKKVKAKPKADIVDLISRAGLSFFTGSLVTGLFSGGLSRLLERDLPYSDVYSTIAIGTMTIIFWAIFSKWGWFKNPS